MLVHGTEKGCMSYLKNLRAKRTAEIGNLTMTKSGKMRDSKFHSLIIINTYISSRRIPNNIVIEKHGRSVAGFKILNPRVVQGKADCKSSYVIMLQHKNIVMLVPLHLNVHRYDFNIKTGWFSHLAKTKQNVIGKMMWLFVLYILFFCYNTDFFYGFLITT